MLKSEAVVGGFPLPGKCTNCTDRQYFEPTNKQALAIALHLTALVNIESPLIAIGRLGNGLKEVREKKEREREGEGVEGVYRAGGDHEGRG